MSSLVQHQDVKLGSKRSVIYCLLLLKNQNMVQKFLTDVPLLNIQKHQDAWHPIHASTTKTTHRFVIKQLIAEEINSSQ